MHRRSARKSSPDVPQFTAVLIRSWESLPVAYEADNLFDFVEARRVVETGSIDTFCGRVIRSNIPDNFALPGP